MVSVCPQDRSVRRLATFLLLIGVMIGIAIQPAQALPPPMSTMSMAQMSRAAMATMPDCTEEVSKDATSKPRKCGMAGCIAMMAAGAPFMLGEALSALAAPVAGEQQDRLAIIAALRGRSTAPEPEPPTALI